MSHTHLIALHKSCHRTQPLVFTDTECTRVATCAGAYMRTHTATCSHTCMCAHTLYEKESNNGNDHPDVHPGGWIYTAVVWDFWEWNKQQRESHTGANEMAETHSSEAEGRKPGSPVFARNAQRPGNWPGQTEKLDGFVRCHRRSSSRNLAKNKDHSATFPDKRMASNSFFFFLESTLFICPFKTLFSAHCKSEKTKKVICNDLEKHQTSSQKGYFPWVSVHI